MTYTLAMAAEQGISIADDGVAEVSMTKARALLTALIRDVRWGRKVGAFTERGKRTAYVVTPELFEETYAARPLVQAFNHMPESEREEVLRLMRPYWP